jgi:PAS domain S-box-containing protein
MFAVDADGQILTGNDRAQAMFGYGGDELTGLLLNDLIPKANDLIPKAGDVPPAEPQESCGLRKDGRQFCIRVSRSTLPSPDGEVDLVAVDDLTEQVAADERARSLAVIVESSKDAIFTKTLDGKITFWNAAAERLYGYRADEIIGQPVSTLAPPDRRAEVHALTTRLAMGEPQRVQTVRQAKDGRLLDVELTLWPIPGPDGKPMAASVIARDTSGLKRAHVELIKLYERERQIATTLQRSLMGTPAQVPGLEIAHEYQPAAGGGVGGDWLDVIPRPDGRVGVLVGDVLGRGVEAATAMGRLRAAGNALAHTGMDPRCLLESLEAAVDEPNGEWATCLYLVMDPNTGEAVVSSAGHLPVLVHSPNRPAYELPAPLSAPLGVGGVPPMEARFSLRDPAVLAFYTDGLVEYPGCDIQEQLDKLKHVITDTLDSPIPDLPLPTAVRTITAKMASLRHDTHDDDVALLLIRFPGVPLGVASTQLPPGPSAPRDARLFLAETLPTWHRQTGRSCRLDDAVLITSELVTNSFRHAPGPLTLLLRHTHSALTIEVTDHGTGSPHRRTARPDDETGRGLLVVNTLSDAWGVRRNGDGKTTWATLHHTNDVSDQRE